MWIAILVLTLVAAAFAMRRQMHMFQLNSYRAKGHLTWLGHHRSYWVLQLVVLIVAALTIAWPVVGGIITLVFLVLAVWVNRPKPHRAKKPLVYTARVIRMLITVGVLSVVLVVLAVVVPNPLRGLIAVLLYALTPLWVLVANWINTPIEAGVRRHYLNDAARMLAAQPGLIKIGITGSFGKTSVKFYLATLLKGHFNVLMTPASYNTPMGITKTVREELRATHEVFIAEMGAERVGEIKADCDLVRPTIGVITAIGEQHLVTFGSQENILRTKLELADAVRGKGMLYLNGDNDLLRTHQPDQERELYGLRDDNDTYAYDLAVSVTGTHFSLSHRGRVFTDLVTPLIGAHTIQNLAGAVAVALDLGVTEAELRVQLKKLAPAPHRLAMSRQGSSVLIDDAYNSNPAGAKAALDTLMLFDGQHILITPGMVQLGERQDVLNEEFGAQAAVCDHVYLIGATQTAPIARGLARAGFDPAKLTVLEDVRQAIAQAYQLAGPDNKVILLENDLPDNY